MNFDKKNNIYRAIMLVIVTSIVTFIITSVLLSKHYLKTDNSFINKVTSKEEATLDSKIDLVRSYLDKLYLGEIKDEDLIESAVKGYVKGLGDEYTEYLTPSEYEDLMIDVNGNYVGIGVYMAQDRYGNVIVLLPIEGSPAEEAQLKTGDIILKVDGEECTGMDLSLVANKVKGEEGTNVELEIQREDQIVTKVIQRRKIEINHIKSQVLEGKIGYIQILSFDDGSSKEFEKALNELTSKGIDSLIIDVRDNGGGIVSEAIDIAELFIPKDKTIMFEIDKNGKEKETKAKKDIGVNPNSNIVVLANENSASASEIFIGALKDNGIAKVIGRKTYGKGVMQEVVPLSIGGALKVTIEEFYTPSKNTINKKGIEPDIEVKEKKDKDTDKQLQKAIEILKK